MAYVNQNQAAPGPDIEAKKNLQAPISAGGAGIGGSTKAPATPGQNVPAQPSAQLSAYLAANQPQSAAFAENVAGNVAGQINTAGAAINPAVNTYTGQLYTVPTDASVNSAVESSPSSLTPEQAATYKTQVGAAGKSPNSANTFETTQGYQDATSGIQKAVEQADLWGAGNDVASLSSALTPFEGANATSGDKTLDSLLLSRTPNAYGKITAATAPARDLPAKLAAGTDAANSALRNAIATNQATTDAAKASGGKYASGLSSTLIDYLAKAQADADTYNSGVNELYTGVSNVQPQIAALKDAVAAYNAMRGSNPATNLLPEIKYGAMGEMPGAVSAPSVGQLATGKQYSDVAALLDLLGSEAPNLPIDPANAAMAGSYTSPVNNIPGVNSVIAPFANPVGPGILAANDVYAAHQGNTPLANERGAFNELQAAYDAINKSMGWQAPPPQDSNQVPPPPGYVPPGTPVGGPENPPPGVTPTPPPGAVPGSPEYNQWLRDLYPGLIVPEPGQGIRPI